MVVIFQVLQGRVEHLAGDGRGHSLQRLALILSANENKVSAEEMARLRQQVLRNLIDETLQIQEAKASEIEIPDEEIDQTYARVAQQNFNQNITAMDAYLALPPAGSSGICACVAPSAITSTTSSAASPARSDCGAPG